MKGCLVTIICAGFLATGALAPEAFAQVRTPAKAFKTFLAARQTYLRLKMEEKKTEMEIVGFCTGPDGIGSPTKCQRATTRKASIEQKLRTADGRVWPGDFNFDGTVNDLDKELLGVCLNSPANPSIDCRLMDLDGSGGPGLGDAVTFTLIKSVYDICNQNVCDFDGNG